VLGSVRFHRTGSILYPEGILNESEDGCSPAFTRPCGINGSGGAIKPCPNTLLFEDNEEDKVEMINVRNNIEHKTYGLSFLLPVIG
jgi:hypothetical protein